MVYPLTLSSIYKKTIWGGSRLHTLFNRDNAEEKIGESWDVSCRDNEMCIVENGAFKGMTFSDVLEANPDFLGDSLRGYENFPLLIKIIDACEDLSVQVHPGNGYARSIEMLPFGKSEAWYILEPPDSGFLIAGLRDGVGRADFLDAIENDGVLDVVNRLFVQKGDVVSIPAGFVHALTKGAVVLEVQQNSDLTYRVYDYGRKGADGKQRPLNIAKSLEVIDFGAVQKKQALRGLRVPRVSETGVKQVYYLANPDMCVTCIESDGKLSLRTDGEKFQILTSVEGSPEIAWDGGNLKLALGRSLFVPANLGKFSLKGKSRVVRSFVPDVRTDFLEPLLAEGYSLEEVMENTDLRMTSI